MRSIVMAAGVVMGLILAGCNSGTGEYKELSDKDAKETAPVVGHHHEHGPHSGHVFDLMNGHAELVFEPSRELTLYLLGDDAETARPAKDTSIKANLKFGDDLKSYELMPMPLDGEAEGASSRFHSSEPLPVTVKDLEDVTGDLVITMGGEAQSVAIEHDHHDEDHHDEDHHDGKDDEDHHDKKPS